MLFVDDNDYLKYNLSVLLNDNNVFSYPIIYTQEMFKTQQLPVAILELQNKNPYQSQYLYSKTSNQPYMLIQDFENKKQLIFGTYPTLDTDERFIKSVVKTYYHRITDDWIYKSFKPLLSYVKMVNGEAKLIDSIHDYNEKNYENDSLEDIERKIIYLTNIILTKKTVKHVLKEIIHSNSEIHWYNLQNYEDKIKHVFNKYIKNKLNEAIRG